MCCMRTRTHLAMNVTDICVVERHRVCSLLLLNQSSQKRTSLFTASPECSKQLSVAMKVM